MAYAHMRNKLTGEFKDVEPDSDEFRELQGQVSPMGQTLWEQTSYPHAEAIQDRAANHALNEEDLGHEDQNAIRPAALVLDAQGIEPEQNPHLFLSPGEVEMGLTPQSKLEEIRTQFEEQVAQHRSSVFGEASKRIAGDRAGEAPDPLRHAGGKGMLARAGGSDERENVPRPDATHQESGSNANDDVVDGDATLSPEEHSELAGEEV